MVTHTGKFHRLLFPSLVWKMPTEGIYLTFDDGPHPTATPEVLKVLQAHKVMATFFLSGQNVAGNESLVKEIVGEGHTVGNHGFRHSRLPAFSHEQTIAEILRTEKVITDITPLTKKIFRPPYGFFSWHTVSGSKNLGYQLVMWTVLTGDFRQWSRSRIVATAVRRLAPGNLLVFHDNESTAGKIGSIVSECINRIQDSGYRLEAI